MTLYVLNYNNYYNRIVKKYNTVQEYLDNVEVIYTLEDTNFNPNDNVNTTHTFGWSLATDNYEGNGNYLLVIDEEENIVSRWFILDSARDTGGQWTCSLRRDVIADHYEAVMSAPCFVEKGNVGFENPLVLNKENMSLNQIKTSETLLKDSTGCPWIVGYIPKDLEQQTHTFTPVIIPDYKFSMDLSEWEYAQYKTVDFKCYPNENSYLQLIFMNFWETERKFFNYSLGGELSTSWETGAFFNGLQMDSNLIDFGNPYPPTDYMRNYFTPDTIVRYFNEIFNGVVGYQSKAITEDFLKYNNKVIQFNDGIYRIKFEESTYSSTPSIYFATDIRYRTIWNKIREIKVNNRAFGGETGNGGNLSISGAKIKLNITKVSNVEEQSYTWKIPSASERAHLQDAPYDMFCMPYGNMSIFNETSEINVDGSIEINTINDIISQLVVSKAGELYDVQLLPYCPLKEKVRNENEIYLANFENVNYYEPILKSEEVVGYMFFVDSSSFSTYIPYEVKITNPKIESNTDMYRLSSPNYNGQFEFNAALNNGISYFTAECTYLPFTPYIHVKPDFKGLYGADNFNDARGLICGGDFSLPIINDAWNQYKLQNKNYQEIFDRQIQNMNKTQNIARIQEGWQVATGAISGVTTGATTGMLAGGGAVGAIVGGVLGGGASLMGGIADMKYNEQLREEAIDYTKDQFQYQLGNIQALPNSLTKVSSFNINNRIFPVLEYYTCTSKEKEIFAKKIAYNGMSIYAIGTLIEYIGDWNYNDIKSKNYVKGRLINIEDFNEDYHILNTISEEVNKGFFIKKEDTE